MSILDAILSCMILLLFIGNLFLGAWILSFIDYCDCDIHLNSFFIALKDFIDTLFWNKNIWGKFLGVIIFIIAIPDMLFVLLVQILWWVFCLILCIWDLGNKK